MINKKTLLYSSLATALTLASGTAAQALPFIVPTPVGKPGPMNMTTTINGFTINYTVGPVAEALDLGTGEPTGDYVYDIENDFYVDLSDGSVTLGTLDFNSLDPATSGDFVQFTAGTLDGDGFYGGGAFEAILDPSGSGAFTFFDGGAASNYTQTFVFPNFNPTIYGPGVNFLASIGGSITNGTNGSPVGVTPFNQAKTAKARLYDLNNNVIATIDVGDAFTSGSLPAGATANYPADNILLNNLNCTNTGCGRVEIEVSFTGTGGGDRYAMTVGYNVDGGSTTPSSSVPEPSTTLGLMGLGLLGFAAKKRRQS